MSTPTQVVYSPEDTLNLIAEIARSKSDRFLVKVMTRRGVTGLHEQYATLADAELLHIQNPEMWLPALVGGGEVAIAVSHMDTMGARIGGFLVFKYQGQTYDKPNTGAMKYNWQGPRTLLFPVVPELPAFAPGQTPYQGNVQMQTGFGPPAQGQQVFARDPEVERERERLAAAQRDLAEQRAKLDCQLADKEHELKEREREQRLREEMNAKTRELELKLAEATRAGQNQKQGPSIVEIIAAVAPLIVPVIAGFQASAAESRKMQMESDRQARDAAAKSAEQFQAVLMKMGEAKGVSPEIAMMMEILKSSSAGSADMMSRMVEAMGTVSKTSVGMIEAIADIQLGGQPDHPILSAVKEGVKALSSLSRGAQTGAQRVVQQQARQSLPSPQQRPMQPQALAGPPQNGAQRQQQAPAPVTHFEKPNAPAPNMPPAAEQAPGFAGVEAQPSSQPPLVEGQVVATLVSMIQTQHPVGDVADFFLRAVQHSAEMKAALNDTEGDVNELFMKHLGVWLIADEANQAYVGALGETIDQKADALGLTEPEEGDQVEAD